MNMLDHEYGTYVKAADQKKIMLQNIMNWTMECIRYSDIITIY